MTTVKLKLGLLIGLVNHAIGDVVAVPDVRASELIREGAAEAHDESAEIANPDHNPLGDFLSPAPPPELSTEELASKLPADAHKRLKTGRGSRLAEVPEPGPALAASPASGAGPRPEVTDLASGLVSNQAARAARSTRGKIADQVGGEKAETIHPVAPIAPAEATTNPIAE